MEIDAWVAFGALVVSGVAAAMAMRANRIAARADRRAAGLTKPVFRVNRFWADSRFTWIEVRNIHDSIAHNSRIRLRDDPEGRIFQPSQTPGMWTGIVGRDETTVEVATTGAGSWEVSAYALDSIVVSFETGDGVPFDQHLELPMMEHVEREY